MADMDTRAILKLSGWTFTKALDYGSFKKRRAAVKYGSSEITEVPRILERSVWKNRATAHIRETLD